jgi:hypothetical protein
MTGNAMKRRSHALFAIPFIAVLLGAPSLRAEIRLGSGLSPESIPEGETSTYQVRIVADQKFDNPVVKTDPSVKVENGGAQQSLQIRGLGGNRQMDVLYTFILTPTKKGTFSVQAEIPIDGDAVVTESSTLTVRAPTAAEKAREPFVKLSLDRTSFYVGERVPYEVNVFLRPDVALRDIGFPQLDSGNFVVDSYGKPQRADNATDGLQTFVFENHLSALKPGEFSFGPAKVQMIILESMGMRRRQRSVDAVSEPLTLTVKPLPETEKPKGFSGAVGTFALALDASPLKLHLGEPIAVELRVTGNGNFDALTLPEFTGDAGWKPYPAKKVEIPNRQTGDIESLSFTQIVVPTTAHPALPPFRLSFFDPLKEKYITLETDSIPLEITPDPQSTNTSIATSASVTPNPDTPDGPPPTEKMEDILTIIGDTSHPLSAPPTRLLGSRGFWIAQSLPIGALAMMFVFFLVRRAEPESRPSLAPRPFDDTVESLRSAPSSLPALDFYTRARACLDSWSYHSGKTLPETTAVTEITERHDFLHYAGNARTAADPVPEPERHRVLEAIQGLSAR